MVALATKRTNKITKRVRMDAKQTTNRGQKTRVNKLPLIAVKAQHSHTPNLLSAI